MNRNDSILIVATNKAQYVQFAINCAESVLLYNDIQIFVVSNLDFVIPIKLQKRVSVIKVKNEHKSLGMGLKIYLDQYTQTKNTLFIDADCLCYSSLNPIFNAFRDKNVSVVGTVVNSDEWCGSKQAKVIEMEFGIKQLPRFNGGLLFLRKNRKTNQIFEFARSIMPDYDRFGFQRNNNVINEEVLIAISMVIHGETPIPDDGRYMTDLHTDHHPLQLNVLTGLRKLNNPGPSNPRHRPWYPIGEYSPIIIHFGGNKLYGFPYITQFALIKLKALKLGTALSTLISVYLLQKPYRMYRNIKKLKLKAS